MVVDQPVTTTLTPVASSPTSESEVAIHVRDLGKMYRIYDRPQDRLKQMLWRGRRLYGREFWALRDVSFEVRKGETVGIIGRNGSGKSTLLQIIAGTLTPTEGDITINGRVAALLELGSGFNPEFTGRENVFLNGSILGFSRAEMEQRFDEIAAFADIGQFLDQPVKTYSSGMFVRLAFAVAVSSEPDVLIVDEALAVGDIFFRQRCYQRLEALRDKGVSILLVSHAMSEVEQFCQSTVLLHHGQAIFYGSSSEAVHRYYLIEQTNRAAELPVLADQDRDLVGVSDDRQDFWPAPEAFFDISNVAQISDGSARCTGVALCDEQGRPCRSFHQGEKASFFFEFELLHDIEIPIGGLGIHSDTNVMVHGKNTLQFDPVVPRRVAGGSRVRFQYNIGLDIACGEYTFSVAIATMSYHDYTKRDLFTHADVDARIVRLCHLQTAGHFAVVFRQHGMPVQLLHYGVANLPGSCEVNIVTHIP